MAHQESDFLIVGGGVAATSCAETVREEGANGSIAVVVREPAPPYHRPRLSKGYLREEPVMGGSLHAFSAFGWPRTVPGQRARRRTPRRAGAGSGGRYTPAAAGQTPLAVLGDRRAQGQSVGLRV